MNGRNWIDVFLFLGYIPSAKNAHRRRIGMPTKSLEERQAEMRQRLSQQKKSPNAPRIATLEQPTTSESPQATAAKSDVSIVQHANGMKTVTRNDLYNL